MPEKKSKYDTDPLDPDFVRRTEEMLGRTGSVPQSDGTQPFNRDSVTEDGTRRFGDEVSDSYPSMFIPPTYEPPRQPQQQQQQQQPFTTFGAGAHGPPAQVQPPPPGPSSPYQPNAAPSSRPVTRLGIPENIANLLPYIPFYIGLVAAIIELAVVPRNETRTRFHAAQGLALQLAIIVGTLLFQVVGAITDSGFGGFLFWLAQLIFLIVSMGRVWQGKPHHIAPLDDASRWLNERIPPMK